MQELKIENRKSKIVRGKAGLYPTVDHASYGAVECRGKLILRGKLASFGMQGQDRGPFPNGYKVYTSADVCVSHNHLGTPHPVPEHIGSTLPLEVRVLRK